MTIESANTLAAFKEAQKSPMTDPLFAALLAKSSFGQSGSATSGLTFYDLEPGAKLLFPVLTPLRNEIPRVTGRGLVILAARPDLHRVGHVGERSSTRTVSCPITMSRSKDSSPARRRAGPMPIRAASSPIW